MSEAARVVMMTPDELEQLVRKAVRAELAPVPPPDGEPEYLSAKVAAKILGCATRNVHYLVKTGGLPHYKTGRTLRFRRVEIEAWVRGKEAR